MTLTETDTPVQYDMLNELLASRSSCRDFLPDQLPRGTIERLLSLAQRTPSWCNTQPWQVAITTGAGTDRFREALLAHVAGGAPQQGDIAFPPGYAGVYRDRRRECGLQLYDSVDIPKEDRGATLRQMMRNFELFGAPHVAVITTAAELGPYAMLDCGLYIDSFLLGAQSLGLGAIAQAALASYSPFIREYFGLPEDRHVVVGISFGLPDRSQPINQFRTTRAALSDVVSWHTD